MTREENLQKILVTFWNIVSLIKEGVYKMGLFDHIRKSGKPLPLSKAIIHTAIITCFGLITGALIKLLDIYTTNLGNIFSQVSVWIFICTLISVYSNSALRAAVNVFGFCMGMLLTYYITAEMTARVY